MVAIHQGGPMSESTRNQLDDLIIQQMDDAVFAHSGRRSFFEYREFGLDLTTDGQFRAQTMRASDVMEQTGWHYHECDVQFVYVLAGWVELEFENGRRERVAAGAGLSIPSGLIHNEIAVSEDFEALEFVSPAAFGTVPVETPAGV
jgi:quercetin dioxygenase-like cupin family protein